MKKESLERLNQIKKLTVSLQGGGYSYPSGASSEACHDIMWLTTLIDELQATLEGIIRMEPATEGGACYYEVFDGDGNSVGTEFTDPLSVIQSMIAKANEGICL